MMDDPTIDGALESPPDEPGAAAADGQPGRSVADLVRQLTRDGYGAVFGVRSDARVVCPECLIEFDLRPNRIDAVHRTLRSDRFDPAMIVATCCSGCGVRGTAVLTFGPGGSGDSTGGVI